MDHKQKSMNDAESTITTAVGFAIAAVIVSIGILVSSVILSVAVRLFMILSGA